MDLHTPQIQGFFKKPVDNLFARPVFVKYLKTIVSPEASVIVSPDAGNAKVARKFADDLCLPVAIGDKIRTCHDENAEILEIIGDVAGKDAVIVDDFSISGGTAVNLASELKRRGAKNIIACFSHIPLSKKGVQVVEESCISTIISTDSVNNPNVTGMKKLKILSVAPLFAEAVKRMQRHETIGDLFDDIDQSIPDYPVDFGSKKF